VLRADLESRVRLLRAGAGADDENVINRRDYLPHGGDELADLAFEVFTRAEQDCLRQQGGIPGGEER
jgi:hypothetical protein